MTEPGEPPLFLWTLFQQLRRRGFALGPEEYEAVRSALRAGFGWSSRRELREVCSALWAKSREERAVIAALFDQHMCRIGVSTRLRPAHRTRRASSGG